LTILKGGLKNLGAGHDIVTAQNGFIALDKLRAQQYDLVVTDYCMADMDGLELLETIRYLHPSTQLMLMTTYGNDFLEAEARRLRIYRCLTKPLKTKSFCRLVQEALEDLPVNRQEIRALSDECYRQVKRVMEQLLADVSARCVILTDAEGRTVARTGHMQKLPMGEMASLLGSSIVTLTEAGRVLDNDTDTINLAYREGRNEHLYAVNVGQQLLLTLIIDRGPYSSRLGSVWYYAQQATLTMRQILGKAEYANPPQIFNGVVNQAFDTELDKLFI
jgi:CheY-like chemotaxis protein